MSDTDKPFHNPFEALRGLARPAPEDGSVEGAAAPQAEMPAAPRPASRPRPIPRAVIRLERSGRGGKEVTVIEHLSVAPAARPEWLRALKAALGCGGTVEGERFVLQGDQRTRLPALLEARGVRKVTVG
jgi:translation initiation factor 1